MNTEKPLVPQGPQLIAPASRRLVYGSLLLAYLATLLPWPQDTLWLVPDFTLVLLFYWTIHAPHIAGLGLAMTLGLLVDLTLGSLIGQHGLTYTVSVYLVILVRRRLENFEVSGRALHLAPVFLGAQALHLILGLAFSLPDADWRYLAAGLVGALLWIPIAHLLDRLTGWTNEMRIEPAAK
ncbi:rod shape-determining protein MreD [Parasulfuritortus cantonensis]|uniref:Rod shape-determining protein MreD n=1 Tax=Parasulfuritortus cantonensis TaxID=2528202 RepID=A0A4R1B4D4_9PROT|nr:rod shape-determining protein MreD [Parasulfuritortus cantonensis]TCJ12781.1 rod shape-determining protein MreD [Parasulfuritortus cantonensis]